MAWTFSTAALLAIACAVTPVRADCRLGVTPASASETLVSLPSIEDSPPMLVGGRQVFACPRAAAPANRQPVLRFVPRFGEHAERSRLAATRPHVSLKTTASLD